MRLYLRFQRRFELEPYEEPDGGKGTQAEGGPVSYATGRWGVGTSYGNVFLCGAGAVRGGGVSGIPGHNAAMAALGK